MNTTELLALREDTFLLIDAAIKASDWDKVFELLDTSQPEQWIKEGESEFYPGKKYEYNDIELLEAVLRRISTGCWPNIKNSTMVQDKGQFAVTTHIVFQVCFGKKQTYEFDGIATTYAPSIKHLTLSTPKSVTDAIKNACKRMGNLLGRSLNRGLENLPTIQLEKGQEIDVEFEKAKGIIASFGSFELSMEWLDKSEWKYNTQLKQYASSLYHQ